MVHIHFAAAVCIIKNLNQTLLIINEPLYRLFYWLCICEYCNEKSLQLLSLTLVLVFDERKHRLKHVRSGICHPLKGAMCKLWPEFEDSRINYQLL